ncbi:hypothetical protein V498_02354 [Pseudogymnoascus sp. VKM F-4517 (FW-2822)]|nr:hypothetical protein V498_02354 [Pseudogymnoascus sp. VKM F-4517 (FW-2822)]
MKQSRDMKYFAASAHVSKWRLEVDCPIYPPIQFPTPGWRFKMKAASLPGRLVRSSQVCSSANVFRAFPRQRHGLQASARHSSTISDPPVAAPRIDFAQMSRNPDARQLHGRVVPASPSYFTGLPQFMDNLLELQTLLRKNETLPVVKPGQAPRVAWQTLESYRVTIGEHVRTSKYQKIIQILNRLNHIHPTLKTPEVIAAIEAHRRTIDPFSNKAKPITIDKFGRALGVGRRKSSTARAWLVEGNGEVLVNGKTLVEAFSRVHDRESAIWALKATERIDKYNVWALVEGGGTTGQAEALTLGVTKALLAHEPLLKPALRRAGCVTRDPRKVERKKTGHVKARKMPAWVKR